MPYAMRKRGSKYSVVNTSTGEVKARATTKAKAEKQLKFLRGLEHGMKPRGKRKGKKK
jgi:hypothetical protein